MAHRIAIIAAVILGLGISAGAPTGAFAHGEDVIEGRASWYGPGFHGRTTANGETFDQTAMTAAHKTLPFGTKVRVTNERNGKSVVVRINDRGPYAGKRIIDLSKAAAQKVGMIKSGTAPVVVEVLGGA